MSQIIHDSRTGADDSLSLFLWDNLSGDWTATSERSSFPVTNLNNDTTDDMWLSQSVTSADAIIDFGSNQAVDAVYCFVAHADSVQIAYSTDNVTYTVIDSGSAADNTLFAFDAVTARYIRIRLTAAVAASLGLAVAFVGQMMVTEQPANYTGVNPSRYARNTQIRPQISESGNWLGSTIQRRGFDVSLEWSHVDADWVETELEPFLVDRIGKPFVLAWRPQTDSPYENDVRYVVSEQDIVPQITGPRRLMSFSVDLKGFGGG